MDFSLQSSSHIFFRPILSECRIWTSYKTENFTFFSHLNSSYHWTFVMIFK